MNCGESNYDSGDAEDEDGEAIMTEMVNGGGASDEDEHAHQGQRSESPCLVCCGADRYHGCVACGESDDDEGGNSRGADGNGDDDVNVESRGEAKKALQYVATLYNTLQHAVTCTATHRNGDEDEVR